MDFPNPVEGYAELHGFHCEAIDLRKHFQKINDLEFWTQSFKFAFVRHPMDWILSTYFHIRTYTHKYQSQVRNMGLAEFIRWYHVELNKVEKPYGANKFLNLREFVTDSHGEVMIDFIGKLENADRDMQEIFENTGLPSQKVQIVNRNSQKPNKPWIDFYDDKAYEAASIFLAEDINFFNYKWVK